MGHGSIEGVVDFHGEQCSEELFLHGGEFHCRLFLRTKELHPKEFLYSVTPHDT